MGAQAAEGEADRDLLRDAAAGSRTAYASLVERHYAVCYRVAWRMTGGHVDCQDIVQEVFLKLWDGRSRLAGLSSFMAYALRAVSNGVIDRSRKTPMTPIESIAEPTAPTDGAAVRQGIVNEVDRAIAALPERQRQALILVYYEGMGNIAAAETMELTVDAVESLLARAKRGLKQRLAPQRDQLLEGLDELNE